MRVLALDTTTRAGSLALLIDGRLVEERQGDPARTHGERLPGDLLQLLARHQLQVDDVDVFGLAAGPGSFTGLRIGIASIQGLAFATGRRVVAVSALEALARRAADLMAAPVPALGIWMDAHRREVFASLWAAAPGGAPGVTRLEEDTVGNPEMVLAGWLNRFDGPILLAGDGALVYRGAAAGHGDRVAILDEVPPIAAEIARMAAEQAADGRTVTPGAIQPIYIRRPDAELARERRAGTAP